jgi:molecular chaperone GrpE (heat shock protein)
MEYDEFFARYKDAHLRWTFGELDRAGALEELTRLRALVPSIDPPDKRRTAESVLRQWEVETSPQAEERMTRAMATLSQAERGDGTVAERIARARAGIAEITRIAAEAEDVAERYAITGLTETLAKLVDALERSGGADPRAPRG